jgi:hypothetical protein
VELHKDPGFITIDTIRNIVAHRLCGRRSVLSSGVTAQDGTRTETREEFFNILGLTQPLEFNEQLLQHSFDDLNRLLTALIQASLDFVRSHQKT